MSRKGFLFLALLGTVSLIALVAYAVVDVSSRRLSPEEVVRRYGAAIHARDYAQAYELISDADRRYKSREEYLRENGPLDGFTQELAHKLAASIQYREIQTDLQGSRATVTVKFVMPDGNAEVVREILFANPDTSEPWPKELPAAQKQALLATLDRLHESGQLPMLDGEQTVVLVKEGRGWRVFENWGEAVVVRFSGAVKAGLPWEFGPAQEVIRARPGETVRTFYRAKNLSDQEVTAKACHLVEPEEYRAYLETIQCFCFVQDTLGPGEEKEMPLVFRVRWDAPPEVRRFDVRYEFYPVESFPENCESPE